MLGIWGAAVKEMEANRFLCSKATEMGNVPITKEAKVNLQGFLMGTLTADKPIFDNASSKESHPEGSQLQPVTQGEPSRSSSAPPPPGERVATVPPTPSTARTPESFIQRTLVTKSDGTAVLESHSAADSMLDHVSREQLAALKSESKRLSTSENTVDRERGIAVSELVEALEGKRGETLYRSATKSVLESTHRAPEGKRGKVIGGGTAIGAGILVGAALQWYASHHQKQHAPLKHTSLD